MPREVPSIFMKYVDFLGGFERCRKFSGICLKVSREKVLEAMLNNEAGFPFFWQRLQNVITKDSEFAVSQNQNVGRSFRPPFSCCNKL